MSTLKQKSSTAFPDLEKIKDPEIKKVLSDLFKVLQGSLTDSYDDANAIVQWEVDGTETQLVTADEIDMRSKKIINVTDPTAAQDAATKTYVDAVLPASPAQGDVIYYNGTAWVKLAAGTSGLLLKTQGAGANPLWALPADLAIASQAQGDILYFNGTNWVRLAPGTSGWFLKTLGAAANPLWAAQADVNMSNVLFQYQGQVDQQGAGAGEYSGTDLNPTGSSGNYRFLQAPSASSNFQIWTTKFIKVAGISTVTVWCRIWVDSAGASDIANLKVDIGGQNGNVSGTTDQAAPEWKSFTIDVSSLTNGTAYDVTAYLSDLGGLLKRVYCSNIIGFGS